MSWKKSLQLFATDWVSSYAKRPQAFKHDVFLNALLGQIFRPGMLDINLDQTKQSQIAQELERISKIFYYGRTQKEVDVFVYTLIKALIPVMVPHEKRLGRKPASVSAQTRARLELELSQGKCENEAIRATARNLYDLSKKKKRAAQLKRVAKDPSLREFLSLPKNVISEIPESDIRSKMLQTLTKRQKRKNLFQQVLNDALPFANKNIIAHIGEDLGKLCKVVGYWDKLQHFLLVIPISSTAAQELQYRKSELLRKLKEIPEFRSVKDIRFGARG